MDINRLYTQLVNQTATGQLILNPALLPQDTVNEIQTDFGLAPTAFLTITNITAADIPQPSGNTITITSGNISVFQLSNLSFNLVFTANSQVVDLCLQIQMPSTWKIENSFPDLTLFPFSLIQLSNGVFIFSSIAQNNFTPAFYNYGNIAQLTEGLSLLASIDLSTIPVLKALLGNALPSGSLVLNGSFSATTSLAYPAIQLSTTILNNSFSIVPGITFDSLSLSVNISNPVNSSVQNFSLSLQAPAGDMNYFIKLTDSAETISLGVQPKPTVQYTLTTLGESTLVQSILPVGTNFNSFVPDPLISVFNNIEFLGASFSFSIASKTITNVSFSIGQTKDQPISLGLFTFSNLAMKASWMNPGSKNSSVFVMFSAQANIPITIFNDPFYFSIGVSEINSKWQISLIEAQYLGAISLANILNEIAPNAKIPAVLSNLYFGKFYVRAQPSADTFTCSCQGAFGTEINNVVLSSNFNLMLTHTAQNTDFLLSGGFAVGNDYWFNLTAELDKSSSSTIFSFTAESNDIPLSAIADHLLQEFDINAFEFPEMNFTAAQLKYNTPTIGQLEITANYSIDDPGVFNQSGTITIKRQTT